MICGLNAWGYAENNIYSGTTDSASCHQLCLANTACKSFQTQDEQPLLAIFTILTLPPTQPFQELHHSFSTTEIARITSLLDAIRKSHLHHLLLLLQ